MRLAPCSGPVVLVGPGHYSRAQVAGWLLAVAAAGVLVWAANLALVLPAIKSADPCLRIRDMIFDRERVQNDVAELSVAVLVTCGVAISLVTLIFALPFVTLLQRSMRHAQLLNASRVDSKTGLLNAGTWEREAASEVARAVRTRSPLALILIDVDHFKLVNDLHGHLAGDTRSGPSRTFSGSSCATTISPAGSGARSSRCCCRRPARLTRAASLSGCACTSRKCRSVSHDPAAPPIRITVSMGVAALGQTWERTTGSQLTDLLAGADRALYQAKDAGRNHVVMVTDTETVGTGPSAQAVADQRAGWPAIRAGPPPPCVTRPAPEIRAWPRSG